MQEGDEIEDDRQRFGFLLCTFLTPNSSSRVLLSVCHSVSFLFQKFHISSPEKKKSFFLNVFFTVLFTADLFYCN